MEIERLGVDFIGVHCAIDDQMKAKNPFSELKDLSKKINIPIAVAGGVNSETAPEAVKSGASIIIIGGAISKAVDPQKAASSIKKSIPLQVQRFVLYSRASQ